MLSFFYFVATASAAGSPLFHFVSQSNRAVVGSNDRVIQQCYNEERCATYCLDPALDFRCASFEWNPAKRICVLSKSVGPLTYDPDWNLFTRTDNAVAAPAFNFNVNNQQTNMLNPVKPRCSKQIQSGTDDAYLIAVNAWDSAGDCSTFEDFTMLLEELPQQHNRRKCYMQGFRQGIRQAVVEIERECQTECIDVGNTKGSFAGRVFCGLQRDLQLRSLPGRCEIVKEATCKLSFRQAVQTHCPNELNTFAFHSFMQSTCQETNAGVLN